MYWKDDGEKFTMKFIFLIGGQLYQKLISNPKNPSKTYVLLTSHLREDPYRVRLWSWMVWHVLWESWKQFSFLKGIWKQFSFSDSVQDKCLVVGDEHGVLWYTWWDWEACPSTFLSRSKFRLYKCMIKWVSFLFTVDGFEGGKILRFSKKQLIVRKLISIISRKRMNFSCSFWCFREEVMGFLSGHSSNWAYFAILGKSGWLFHVVPMTLSTMWNCMRFLCFKNAAVVNQLNHERQFIVVSKQTTFWSISNIVWPLCTYIWNANSAPTKTVPWCFPWPELFSMSSAIFA